jgi:hypothetical protein
MKMNILKKLGCAAVLIAGVAFNSQALTVDYSTMGVGNWDPGSAYNNDTDATTAANALVTWYNGGANANGVLAGATFTLASTSLAPLPNPLTFSFKDDSAPFVSFDASLYSYVLGKYGNVTYLFYIGNLSGMYDLPLTGPNQLGLSHEIGFVSRTSVPDGGMTVIMLGSALAGLGAVRRFIKR